MAQAQELSGVERRSRSTASLPAVAGGELRYTIGGSGFRVREVTLATTLLDAEALYTSADLAGIVSRALAVETNLKNLKTTMK